MTHCIQVCLLERKARVSLETTGEIRCLGVTCCIAPEDGSVDINFMQMHLVNLKGI